MTNEAFARVEIDQLLRDIGWKLTDGRSVRFEYPLDDGGKADYALFDRQGRALAVLEAKSTSVNLSAGEAQGRRYADQLDVPFIFLSNGEEVWFCDKDQDAHFRPVETVFSQDDLVRRRGRSRHPPQSARHSDRSADRRGWRAPLSDRLHRRPLPRDRQRAPEDACRDGDRHRQDPYGRRPAKTPVRGALGDARLVRRRPQPARPFRPKTPSPSTCHTCPAIACRASGAAFRTRSGSPSSHCKRWSTNTQKYSAGYFDLIVIDECHRSIYGQWRRALDHFDAIKLGLTATPCVMQDDADVDEEDRQAIRDTLRFFEVQRPTYSYTLTGGHRRRPPGALRDLSGHDGAHRRHGWFSRGPRRNRLGRSGRSNADGA